MEGKSSKSSRQGQSGSTVSTTHPARSRPQNLADVNSGSNNNDQPSNLMKELGSHCASQRSFSPPAHLWGCANRDRYPFLAPSFSLFGGWCGERRWSIIPRFPMSRFSVTDPFSSRYGTSNSFHKGADIEEDHPFNPTPFSRSFGQGKEPNRDENETGQSTTDSDTPGLDLEAGPVLPSDDRTNSEERLEGEDANGDANEGATEDADDNDDSSNFGFRMHWDLSNTVENLTLEHESLQAENTEYRKQFSALYRFCHDRTLHPYAFRKHALEILGSSYEKMYSDGPASLGTNMRNQASQTASEVAERSTNCPGSEGHPATTQPAKTEGDFPEQDYYGPFIMPDGSKQYYL